MFHVCVAVAFCGVKLVMTIVILLVRQFIETNSLSYLHMLITCIIIKYLQTCDQY